MPKCVTHLPRSARYSASRRGEWLTHGHADESALDRAIPSIRSIGQAVGNITLPGEALIRPESFEWIAGVQIFGPAEG